MGVWIAIAIGLFVLGSIMALKPSGVEMRLDKLRLTARRLALHPKLIACPDWIRGRDHEFGRGMMGQYTLMLEDVKLPETYYQVIDGELRPQAPVSSDTTKNNHGAVTDPSRPSAVVNYTLDREPLDLPEVMVPLVKGVYSKANSLVVFWEDSSYVKPNHNLYYAANNIEPDLLALKAKMQFWANKLATGA